MTRWRWRLSWLACNRSRCIRALAMGAVLAVTAAVVPVAAQKVTPRLTGAMVMAHLAKAEHGVQARATLKQHAKLQKTAAQLQQLSATLADMLGKDAHKPLATIDADARDAAMRANAAATRVKAWLAASKAACTEGEIDAMLDALTSTLKQLAADDASQKAPLPVIDDVRTLDQRPLFALRQGGKAVPKFVLIGANLVDKQCANPTVVVVDAQGTPVKVQPQLVAAQPSRVELQWPGAGSLTPGSYVLQLTAERKRFLFGCASEPAAVAVLAVLPPRTFNVSYTLKATCAGQAQPVVLGKGTLPPLTASQDHAARTIDSAACKQPVSYTISGTMATDGGQTASFGPVTQGAGVTSTSGIGHGLTLRWDPFQHQLFVQAGKQSCPGLY